MKLLRYLSLSFAFIISVALPAHAAVDPMIITVSVGLTNEQTSFRNASYALKALFASPDLQTADNQNYVLGILERLPVMSAPSVFQGPIDPQDLGSLLASIHPADPSVSARKAKYINWLIQVGKPPTLAAAAQGNQANARGTAADQLGELRNFGDTVTRLIALRGSFYAGTSDTAVRQILDMKPLNSQVAQVRAQALQRALLSASALFLSDATKTLLRQQVPPSTGKSCSLAF